MKDFYKNLKSNSSVLPLITDSFLTFLENTTDMVFVKDKDFRYVIASKPFVKMTGKKSIQDIIGKTDFEIFEDKNLAKRYREDDIKLFKTEKNLLKYHEPLADVKGEARYGETSKFILKDEAGNHVGIFCITKDITKDYILKQHYQKELEYLFKLPKNAYAIVYIDIESWRIIAQRRQDVANTTLESCTSVEELIHFALKDIKDTECEAAQFYSKFNPKSLQQLFNKGKMSFSFNYLRNFPDDTQRWVRNDIRLLIDMDSGHQCIMLSAFNVDAEKLQEQNLIEAAQIDKMTKVLNRETAMKQIRQTLSKEKTNTHALFMFDVDNFKQLNDTLGHQKGDMFLVALSKELRHAFRESDIVGRIGGDEFFVLMKNTTDLSIVIKKAQAFLHDIQILCAEFPQLPLSVSIGISIYPQDGKTLKLLYTQADKALYKAKKSGKNCFVFAQQDD